MASAELASAPPSHASPSPLIAGSAQVAQVSPGEGCRQPRLTNQAPCTDAGPRNAGGTLKRHGGRAA
jgi:hypothetical protein